MSLHALQVFIASAILNTGDVALLNEIHKKVTGHAVMVESLKNWASLQNAEAFFPLS